MHYIALSVLCSVIVSVLLKLARRYHVDVNQAITVNYLVAALLTLALLDPAPAALFAPGTWRAWPVIVALGILLPSIFAVLAWSVRRAGIVRTDAAQRLSLLLPLLAAFTVFGEALSWSRGAGIGIGLLAIGCLLVRRASGNEPSQPRRRASGWPLAVFVGMGFIDILFKQVARLTAVPFASVLLAAFVLAFVVSVLAIAVLLARGAAQLHWRHLGGGVLLGLFNFGNIALYIQAHRALSGDPALVFSAMNIGVIALATLVGVGLFRERLNRWNSLGLMLAAVAVLILASA